MTLWRSSPTHGKIGIAHTRWATHGVPSERNAHPHISRDGLAIVHNGIIENHDELRADLQRRGYKFDSETDTEVIAHRIHYHLETVGDLFKAVRATVAELEGAYALAVVSEQEPERLIVAREGCPVVIGLGMEENFVASDVAALLPVTRRFMFLEEGDVAEVRRTSVRVLDRSGNSVERPARDSELSASAAEKGQYAHFMLKEIYEQPSAIADTLQERVANGRLLEAAFGPAATEVFRRAQQRAHRRLRHELPRRPPWRVTSSSRSASVPAASKSRASTATAVRWCRRRLCSSPSPSRARPRTRSRRCAWRASPAICRRSPSATSPESSLVRESELVMLTRAGPEIGVASTKAFTTQLTALGMLVVALAKHNGGDAERERGLVSRLIELPALVEKTLGLDPVVKELAKRFADKRHALFLGRGALYPIALEGALKLKEISYLHAEGYPAGELKHGPLALVDADMPVVTVAPNNDLLEKLKSNLMEVRARGGELIVFADPESGIKSSDGVTVIKMPRHVAYVQAPIVYTIPLQLLAYHVAILKGTDVDQPRNLAKSVTVE